MYEWILWFHVVSFISWFAVLFYLPRLFIYHTEHKENEGFVKVVKIQEYKLFKYIGVPAMWTTVLSGSYLVYEIGFAGNTWLHAKLLFVAILIVYFFSMNFYRKQLEKDECFKSGKFFRMYNEVPTILMMLIVAMVVIKPF
ncbi:protoporphyrinogen oxidase HemJ [Sulfurimonas sp. SAG-AH-194-C21]|nr:protoporphyrinogen oxidase HemJ [Sulfurimonas sp. SAG-AH-194-C21]MDF1882366.1 protoporphyrinogen oxidase HemJ [Sulfurimonas sp. SAG-AH-194-C21]